jgi:DNA repair protein RecO
VLQSATAIVLTRRKVGEADAIVRVLLESGATREIRLHGIRKSRQRSNLLLEPGSLVRLTYYEGEESPGVTGGHRPFASLKEGHVVERFSRLKDAGYGGLLILSYFLELAGFGARAGEAPELFLLIKGTLEELAALQDPVRERQRFALLAIFFKVRVLKTMGLVGDARACTECGRDLADLALWILPEVHFQCEQCAPDAGPVDARAARVIAAAGGMRFARFAGYLAGWPEWNPDQPASADLPEWMLYVEQRLIQCMEHYQGGPLRAAVELREQLARL